MILVRHAESEWNRLFSRTRIDPGIPDPALTETGRRQAERLIGQLAAAGVSRLIASPYRRTLETATIVAKALGLTIAVEPLVRERCVFSCDLGTCPDRLAEIWPELTFAHLEETWWGGPEESEGSIARRAGDFRAQTVRLHDRARIAVITHWGFIRALTGQEVANAACLRLEWATTGERSMATQT
jgi:glucosyl-3-phosphoglycerate phosphatase